MPPTAFETSSGVRNRRVVAGAYMVTPAELIIVNGEELVPGKDRFALEHPWVRARPGLFLPCDRRDRHTARAMKTLLRKAERYHLAEIERLRNGGAPSESVTRNAPRRRASSRPRLPGGPVGTWKL